ncbi:Glycopeptide [Mycena kentingensis (nom. inval.)]|nr:Glycopeptide [Mycena kentingensis (nom. inval.)]
MIPRFVYSLSALLLAAGMAAAETHTVTMVNNCGGGSIPTLVQGGKILSTGEPYTANGRFETARAFLQQGSKCSIDGMPCTVVEITLGTDDGSGNGSQVNLSLIPPLAFTVKAGFKYTKGCSSGAVCGDANCPTAYHVDSDHHALVPCPEPDNSVEITFC